MQLPGFDLEKYLNHSKKVDVSGLDFAAAARFPLSDDEVRCLTYMMDIESHTIVYLKGILNTCAAARTSLPQAEVGAAQQRHSSCPIPPKESQRKAVSLRTGPSPSFFVFIFSLISLSFLPICVSSYSSASQTPPP